MSSSYTTSMRPSLRTACLKRSLLGTPDTRSTTSMRLFTKRFLMVLLVQQAFNAPCGWLLLVVVVWFVVVVEWLVVVVVVVWLAVVVWLVVVEYGCVVRCVVSSGWKGGGVRAWGEAWWGVT